MVKQTPEISVVVPMFNEAEGIAHFHNELLLPALQKHVGKLYEVIYVDDGSSDNTLQIITEVAEQDPRIRVISLSRNFGKEIAITAGLSASTGQASIVMDSDGQHPPAILGEFIDKWKAGAQVVVGIRESNQKEGLIKRWGSKLFYKLFNSAASYKMVPRSTDYRLIDRVVRTEFLRFVERNRISRGLIDWLGFDRAYVKFHSPERIAGQASYSINQLVRLALNSFTSLTLRPLFFFGWVGVAITCLSFLAGTFIFIEQYVLSDPLSLNFTGTALLGVFISLLVGIVLTSQGIMAVYLSHVHSQTQGRPLYVINPSRSYNLSRDN